MRGLEETMKENCKETLKHEHIRQVFLQVSGECIRIGDQEMGNAKEGCAA